jgi:hypothetical protein
MPLDINAAPASAGAVAPAGRAAVIAAVERYLAARGFAPATPPQVVAPQAAPPQTAPAQTAPAANVAAEVVDRFLAKKENSKGAAESAGGYG